MTCSSNFKKVTTNLACVNLIHCAWTLRYILNIRPDWLVEKSQLRTWWVKVWRQLNCYRSENVETSYVLKAKLKEMENTSFVQLESFHSHPPKFGEIKIFASDLVPGNAVLNRVALRFLNQYGIQITDELYPAVGPILDHIQMDMCNKMLIMFPFDVLLPPTRTHWYHQSSLRICRKMRFFYLRAKRRFLNTMFELSNNELNFVFHVLSQFFGLISLSSCILYYF